MKKARWEGKFRRALFYRFWPQIVIGALCDLASPEVSHATAVRFGPCLSEKGA